MIFAVYSQVPALHCKQTQTSLKNYNSGLGFWSPRRNVFSDPLQNSNPCLGRDPYYGNYWLKHVLIFRFVSLYRILHFKEV